MSEDTNVSNEEQVTSTEPEQDLELDLNLEDENQEDSEGTKAEVPTEDLNALKQRLNELENKNKQLYARLKKTDQEKKPQTNSQPDGDLDWKRKIEFITTKGRDLDAEDIDEVIAYAKGKGIAYDEALNATVIKSYLRVKHAKAKVASATPPTSSGHTMVNGKAWSSMNEQERSANFSKMMKKRA